MDIDLEVRADLKAYYEAEAQQGSRKLPAGRRVELRSQFLELLGDEGRHSVVDFGSGPGGDGLAFEQAGHAYVGLDLAHGNAVLAAEQAVKVLPASLSEPPLRNQSFDAGWSMSTLMHLPEAEVPQAIGAMAAVLRSGAPLIVGMWGGMQGEHLSDIQIEGQRRLFRLQSPERNRELLESAMLLEREEVWSIGPDDWNYQVFLLRAP